MAYDFDLFTIGAGSGGVRASRIAAGHGARVAVAEERYLGGTCVNVGCIPKKLFVYASHVSEEVENAASFGWEVQKPAFEWPTLLANKNREIERLNGVYARLLDGAGVSRLEGTARIVDPHTVEVDGRRVTAERILVATGGWPALPDVPGAELAISSNEAFYLESLPERVLIVGGGYIAVEFAGIFHGLGVDTTQLYRGPLFLRGFDDDVRNVLAEEMRAKGIDLRFDLNVRALERRAGRIVATLTDGSEHIADQVLFATGRLPKTEALGLAEAGVKLADSGAIVVDEWSQTSVPSIYAVGDVTDRINLTPVALAEGHALADTLYGGSPRKVDYRGVPSAVFSQPPLATVGLSEAQARESGIEIDVYKSRFRALKHTLGDSPERTFMKLVVERATDRVLGCHMLGPDSAEIIQGLAVALKAGASKADFDSTIGIHPTSAEEFVTMRDKAP